MGFDMDWVEPSDNENESYFRVASSSMKPMRDAMEKRGMAHWWGPSMAVATVDFRAVGHAGIPLAKLSSNDGWLVHPEEIREALEADLKLAPVIQGDLGDPDRWDLERWRQWITFLRGAADNGGFKVL